MLDGKAVKITKNRFYKQESYPVIDLQKHLHVKFEYLGRRSIYYNKTQTRKGEYRLFHTSLYFPNIKFQRHDTTRKRNRSR